MFLSFVAPILVSYYYEVTDHSYGLMSRPDPNPKGRCWLSSSLSGRLPTQNFDQRSLVVPIDHSRSDMLYSRGSREWTRGLLPFSPQPHVCAFLSFSCRHEHRIRPPYDVSQQWYANTLSHDPFAWLVDPCLLHRPSHEHSQSQFDF